MLYLLFSASYVIRKENYQISISLFFSSRQSAICQFAYVRGTWLWRNDGTEREIKMLQILHLGSAEPVEIRNESFIMIGTLGEELWKIFLIFGSFFRFFHSSSKLYAVHLADFFNARYKCTKDCTRLKNFFDSFSNRSYGGKYFGKKCQNNNSS